MTLSPNAPVAMVRIDPPADVTNALANLRAACTQWAPVPVSAKSFSFVAALQGGESPEAAACSFVPDAAASFSAALIFGVIVGGGGWVIISTILRFLSEVVRILYRAVRARCSPTSSVP